MVSLNSVKSAKNNSWVDSIVVVVYVCSFFSHSEQRSRSLMGHLQAPVAVVQVLHQALAIRNDRASSDLFQ